jgi:hypothetical protein
MSFVDLASQELRSVERRTEAVLAMVAPEQAGDHL